MKSMLEKIFQKRKLKKLCLIYEKAEKLIEEGSYHDAGQVLLSAVKLSENVLTFPTYNLLKIHNFFLAGNYDICLDIYRKAIKSIELNSTYTIDDKKYFYHFIYRIVYISNIFCNNFKDSENILLILESISLNKKAINDYFFETYPLYDGEKLYNHLKNIGYIEEKYEEKLSVIVTKIRKLNTL